jgi:hypothetical protein
MENIGSSLKGIYRDIIKDRNNTIIYDSGWVPNKIVSNCRALLAAFMKNDAAKPATGIVRLKVGKGLETWDTDGAPVPDDAETGLVTPHPTFEIGVGALDFVYLNASGAQQDDPTNLLQVTATLGKDQPPVAPGLTSYPLREFGLFGEYNDGTQNHEYMIDCIRHPLIEKDKTTTLIRVVRLYF